MPANQEIKELYKKKSKIRKELFSKGEEVLSESSLLKTRKAYIISNTDKETLGTNDKKRDAYILEHTKDIVEELEKLESEKRSLDLEYSLICDSIECVQWQIRNEQAAADCEAQRLGII
jgi:NAD+--asparagine ADP-ribosyltransferase